MKFNICLMNPPYAGGFHERFLYKMLQISNELITVQPDSYLFKGKDGNQKIKEILNNGNTNIESIDANKYFDGAFQNRIAILRYENNNSKNIIYNDQKIDSLNNLDFRYGDNLILEFKDKIKDLLNNTCSSKWKGVPGSRYKDRYIENEDPNIWVVQCVLLRGNVAPQQKDGKADDFYTFIPRNETLLNKQFIGKYKDLIQLKDNKGKTKLQYYFTFDNKEEAQNFINYLKTDFARTCLYLKKKDMNVLWNMIPWFNFNDEHFSKSPIEIDDWLFKKYNISDEIRKYIEKILPDYYGIRKNI